MPQAQLTGSVTEPQNGGTGNDQIKEFSRPGMTSSHSTLRRFTVEAVRAATLRL